MNGLNDIQIDALNEIINLGMGKAAYSLSEIVQEEVTLSVPNSLFLSKNEVCEILDANDESRLSGVSQQFQGKINGDAILLFPELKSLEIVRLFLKESVPLHMLTEMEQDALSEIGNIILNAGLSSISDFMQTELDSGLPKFRSGSSREFLNDAANDDEPVLFVKVEFGLKSREICGYVLYLMNLGSLEQIAFSIDNYLNNLMRAQG